MVSRVLRLPRSNPRGSRPGDDVSFSPDPVAAFVNEYTRPGQLVFGPFAGFGTTLAVAERMGRRALGLEILPERVAHVRSVLADPEAVRQADARRLDELPRWRAGPAPDRLRHGVAGRAVAPAGPRPVRAGAWPHRVGRRPAARRRGGRPRPR